LAEDLINSRLIPAKAIVDATHIAIAAANGMDYLLTWNCTHIANVEIRGGIESICAKHDVEAPAICTPEELMGWQS
jgi:hypothetical protein